MKKGSQSVSRKKEIFDVYVDYKNLTQNTVNDVGAGLLELPKNFHKARASFSGLLPVMNLTKA